MLVDEMDMQVLWRLLQLDGERLSSERAKEILSLDFTRSDRKRIEKLGKKANQGELTPRERKEYASFIRVSDWLSVLQSRARMTLKKLGKTG